jgi:hypothetical protein
MQSILLAHVAPPAEPTELLDAALDRLGSYLDCEQETLGRVLAMAGRRHAREALRDLGQLHLPPEATVEDLRVLLEMAQVCLEYLLETVSGIPSRYRLATAYGIPGPDAFDRHVVWSGARLEDILATIRHALAAS